MRCRVCCLRRRPRWSYSRQELRLFRSDDTPRVREATIGADGTYRLGMSLFVEGRPLGPFADALDRGDKVLIEGTGAYTATYSSVAFNGFSPLKTYHI